MGAGWLGGGRGGGEGRLTGGGRGAEWGGARVTVRREAWGSVAHHHTVQVDVERTHLVERPHLQR